MGRVVLSHISKLTPHGSMIIVQLSTTTMLYSQGAPGDFGRIDACSWFVNFQCLGVRILSTWDQKILKHVPLPNVNFFKFSSK